MRKLLLSSCKGKNRNIVRLKQWQHFCVDEVFYNQKLMTMNKPSKLPFVKKLKAICFIAFFIPSFLFATEKEIEAKIDNVTLFFSGAQINRNAFVDLKPGTYELVLSDIENNIDNNSIQIRGNGDYLIKSYFTRRNYLQEVDYSDEIRNLLEEYKGLTYKIEDLNIDASVLNDEMNMILANQILSGKNEGLDIEQLKQASVFYQTRLKEIRKALLKIKRDNLESRNQQQRVNKQINQLRSFKKTSVNQLVINIEVEKYTKGKLEISYYIPNASWSPFYEVMVDEINKPIHIVYKANVNQSSGVEWKDVNITLSTTQPNLSGQVPTLAPWNISFTPPPPPPPPVNVRSSRAEIGYQQSVVGSGAVGTINGTLYDGATGEPLPYATVVLRDANGNTVNGATTDFDGKYSISVKQNVYSLQLSYMGYQTQILPINNNNITSYLYGDANELMEVVVMESADEAYYSNSSKSRQVYKASTLSRKATFFEYKISSPYTIPSNNITEVVHIRDVEVNAHFEYQTVPKLDKDVFLIAQIYGWEEYNLLNGSARLYFEKTFVGESYLNVELTKDTLGLSLGRDKNIIVSREKVYEESGTKSFSGNKKETRQFLIQVRSNKTAPIEVVVKDQYPLATDKKISVKLEEDNDARVDQTRGFLTWKILLEPTQTVKKEFKYTVTYPADYQIYLTE